MEIIAFLVALLISLGTAVLIILIKPFYGVYVPLWLFIVFWTIFMESTWLNMSNLDATSLGFTGSFVVFIARLLFLYATPTEAQQEMQRPFQKLRERLTD